MKKRTKNSLIAIIGVTFMAIVSFVLKDTLAEAFFLPFELSPNNYNATLINSYQTDLQSKAIDPTLRAALNAKMQLAARDATEESELNKVASATIWADKQTKSAQLTKSPIPYTTPMYRPTGIIIDKPNPGYSKADDFSSFWIQDYGDSKLYIFVGHEIEAPMQGIICVEFGIPSVIPDIRIKVPGDTGNLKLESAEGDWLFISAENGSQFKFNKFTYQLLDAKTGDEIAIEIQENKVQEGYP